MIFIAAFEISGTYNGSAIEQGLRNLQQQLNSLKAPKIAPQMDMSNFFNQMDIAGSQATKGRMSKMFSGVDFGGFGRQAGTQYATSFMAGLGPIGMAAGDLAAAIGPIGLAAGVAAAGVALLGAKSVQAAAAWESMATSIGRTTGLEGQNLTNLMDSLQDLRMEMGITREAAAGLVEQAGSIGVGQAWLDKGDIVAYKNELLDFARSTAMLQGAWGMSAEATSAGIGKMGSVTLGAWNAQRRAMGEQELSWSEYAENVGGKVDSLANTMGSSEEEIVTAMRNASSAVASFAPTEDTYGKWLALSSFLIDTGASAGEAGTQIERMAKGAKQHGAELAAILGMDKTQFQETLKEDFVGTFQAIAEELASMPESERPDMIKLLGIEGSGAMDKMIADVKTGVNKLNKAIELDPSNIKVGFEKVADDANIAFSKIAQAAQVSFEQMGGVILPIVTDIANAIADRWQKANENGRKMFLLATGQAKEATGYTGGGATLTVNESGLLGRLGLSGEWLIGDEFGNIRRKTAEEIATGAKEGSATAASNVADNLASGISEKVASELEEAAKKFDADQAAYIKSHPGGMSVSNLYDTGTKTASGKTIYSQGDYRIVGGNDDTTKNYEEQWTRLLTTFPETYTMRKMTKTSGQSSGYIQVIDESGDVVGQYPFAAKYGYSDSAAAEREAEEMIKPAVLSMPKYLKTVSDDMAAILEDVTKDGILFPLTEKPLLESSLESLKTLETEHPIEFKAAGLDKMVSDIEATLAGKSIEIEVTAKTVWEDWSSAAYREKFLAENPALSALLTPSEGDAMSDFMGKIAEDAENGDTRAEEALQSMQEAMTGFADGTIESMGYTSEAIAKVIELYPQLGMKGSWLRKQMSGYKTDVMDSLQDTEQGTYYPYQYSIWDPTSKQGSMWNAPEDRDLTVRKIDGDVKIDQMGTVVSAVQGGKLATDTLAGKASAVQNGITEVSTEAQSATVHLTGIESHTSSMVGLLSSIDGKIGALAGAGSQSITKFVTPTAPGPSSLGSVASKIIGGSIKGLFSSANAAYQEGGVPAQSGMAWLDKGDVVIGPNSSIAGKGNLPAAADTASSSLKRLASAADESSAAYQTTWRWFEDYAYKITAPASYQWSKYPAEPNVNVKGDVPVAWLSEGQPTGMDYIDAELQEVIAKSIGNSLVKPWFAGGYEAQPEWWTAAATKQSPKYADVWAEPKGGEIAEPANPAAVKDAASRRALTVADVWDSIYGESFTEGCIAANAPDKSLIYTPSASAIAEAGRTWGKESTEAWSYLYGESFTEGCISTNPPDKLLKFTPSARLLEEAARAQGGAWGSQIVGGSGMSDDELAQSIDDNTESLKALFPILRILNSNIATGMDVGAATKTSGTMSWGTPKVSDALTTASIWSAIYDDSGTCIAYVKPDPSLNFTPGKEYLPGGKWYHGNETVGRTLGQGYGDQAIQEMSSYSEGSDAVDAIEKASATESTDSEQISNILTWLNSKMDKSNTTAAKSDTTLNKIESNTGYTAAGLMAMSWGGSGGYGSMAGSNIIGLANRGGNISPGGFGGTSVSGMGGWIAASPGPAPGSAAAGWMNAGAQAVGGSGAIQWAEGGFADRATLGIFGEAGREAFVPISDRAAGLRILPHVMRELGVAAFATGGIIQSQTISGSGAITSTLGQTVVDGVVTNQYATHSGGEPTVAMGDINVTIQGDADRSQIRDLITQLRREWKEERNNLVRTLKQARVGGRY